MAKTTVREGSNPDPKELALPAIASKDVTRGAGVLVAAIAILVLVGWTFDAEALKRVSPGLVAMNPVTAVAFILSGAALYLAAGGRGRATIVPGIAALVGLVGLLRLVELIIGLEIGVDRLMFRDQIGAGGAEESGRMAPNTAFCLALVGAALLLLDVRVRRVLWPAQVLALAILGTSLLALIGYAFGASALYGAAFRAPMALHAALAFVVLAVGVLCAGPRRGIMGVVNSDGVGGVVVRRLLPAVVLVPPVLGWLGLKGEQAGLYGTEVGASLLVASSTTVFAALVWWGAWAVGRLDEERKKGERASLMLAAIVESSEDAIIGLDLDGTVRSWNGGAEKLYGYAAGEILGGHISITVPPDRQGEVGEILEGIRRGEAVRRRETVCMAKDGGLLDVSLTISPTRDSAGRVVGISTIARDFSARKEAEQKLREAEAR